MSDFLRRNPQLRKGACEYLEKELESNLTTMRRFALAALLALAPVPVMATAPAPVESLRQLLFSPDGR